MISTTIEFTNNGLKEIFKKIEAISTQEIAGIILDDIKSNVENSIDVRGGSLKPLADSTVKQKRYMKLPLPNKPLYGTGQLYNSFKIKNKSKNETWIIVNNRRKKSDVINQDILKWQTGLNRQVFGISQIALNRLKQRYG